MRVHWIRKLRHQRSDPTTSVDARPAPIALFPRVRAPGELYVTLAGLHVTVTALDRDAARATEGARVVLMARVVNPTAAPVEFDNAFGIVDGRGAAHPRGYAAPGSEPAPLPPSLTMAPGTTLEGSVSVHLERGTPPPFHPAYLATVERGCSSCPGGAGVELVPMALWQAAM